MAERSAKRSGYDVDQPEAEYRVETEEEVTNAERDGDHPEQDARRQTTQCELLVALDADDRRIDLTAKDTDLAIRIGPMVDSALIARRLPSVDLWLCASPAYLAARGTPRTVAELAAHSLVDRQDRTDWRFAGGGVIEVEPRVIIPDASAQKVVVEGGAGIGHLPDYLVRPAVASGRLVRVLPDVIAATIEVHALYPSHRSLSAKVRVFIDALAAHMRVTASLAEGG